MNKIAKPSKSAKALILFLNSVVHHLSLYAGHSRFINAHWNGGEVVVENLQTGALVPVAGLSFRDGHGHPVNFTS